MWAFGHASHHTQMFGDSSAMKGTLSRKGSGKVKHLETRQLWLQEETASGNVVLLKFRRVLNPADALAHFWCKADGIKHFSKMSLQATSQRSSLVEEGARTHDKNESRMNLLYARAYWGVPTPWL